MKQYIDLVNTVLSEGDYRMDRTGTGCYSYFGYQMRIDLSKGFPLLTTKKVFFKAIVHELLWFLSGSTNIKYLKENNVKIWDEWATDEGELGPVYGKMWRSWPNMSFLKNKDNEIIGVKDEPIDQIKNVINEIKNNPYSRRLIVSGWNPALLPNTSVSPKENAKNDKQALPPCHTLFQFFVSNGKLSCQLYQRSGDLFLGVPFNIASYALLLHMMAKSCDLEVGNFIHTFGDVHIYTNHLEQLKEQISREPKDLPTLDIPKKDLFEYNYDDIMNNLKNYNPHPPIKGKAAV